MPQISKKQESSRATGLRLPNEIFEGAQQAAANEGVTFNRYIWRAVEDALEKQKPSVASN